MVLTPFTLLQDEERVTDKSDSWKRERGAQIFVRQNKEGVITSR